MESVDGTMYIPRGQCDLCLKDEYSMATAVRVATLSSVAVRCLGDIVKVARAYLA